MVPILSLEVKTPVDELILVPPLSLSHSLPPSPPLSPSLSGFVKIEEVEGKDV